MFLQSTIQFAITEEQLKKICADDDSRNKFTNFMAKFPGADAPLFNFFCGPYIWVTTKELNAFADFVQAYQEKLDGYFAS